MRVSYCVPEAVRSVRVVHVIETVSLVGAGVEDDPAREVRQLWSLDGTLLASYDPVRSGPAWWPKL